MKSVSIALAVLFAATAALTVSAQAAEEKTAGGVQAPAAAAPAAKKKIKPHSHLEERGLAASSGKWAEAPASGDSATKSRAKDTTRHLHPRDGK